MTRKKPVLSKIPTNKDRRFGVLVPRNGKPAPFRVLIGWRWLMALLATSITVVSVGLRLPRRLRLPTIFGGGLAAAAGLLGAMIGAARRPVLERFELPIDDLPSALDGFTIAQLSDLHLGLPFTHANLRSALELIDEQRPDLLVFTGDFVDRPERLPLLLPEMANLSAPYGVYAVLGNHDYWSGVEPLVRALSACGIRVLRNERHLLAVHDTPLVIAGLDCVWEQQHDLQATLCGVAPNVPVILLAHEPDIADEVARYNVAVQLSGHTHAGHIALPGLGPMFLPRHGFRYFRGLHRVRGTWVYITRGLGGLPLRLGGRPEATIHVLRSAR